MVAFVLKSEQMQSVILGSDEATYTYISVIPR